MSAPEPDTKNRILDAAERLFAERGYAASSLRSLTASAGVNLAAAHYHFGSKRELFRAVIERRVGTINEQRLKALERLRSGRVTPPPVEEVLDALLRPVVASPEPEGIREISAVMFRESIETAGPILLEVFGEIEREFIDALCEALPHLSRFDVHERFLFSIGTLVQVASGQMDYFLRAHDLRPRAPEELLAVLTGFLAAALRAPAPGTREGAVS